MAGTVAKNDVIHADVAPIGCLVIHNHQLAGLAHPLPHIPAHGLEMIIGRACGREDDDLIDEKIHTGATLVIAAPDKEGDVVALDRERTTSKPANSIILFPDLTSGC